MVKLTNHNLKYITKESGIYIIWSDLTQNMYIGSTKNFRKRYSEHFNMLKRNKHDNKKLQNYVNKYGIESLNFCIHAVLPDNGYLRSAEIEEINLFDTYKNGFNLTDNTYESSKAKWTIEAKQKLSDHAKERQSKPEVKEQLRIQNSGINNPGSKLNEEQINFIRTNFIRINKRKNNIKELSLKFKVDRRTIYRIVNNITYKQ